MSTTTTQAPQLNSLAGSIGYGPNATTATTSTQRRGVRTTTNTTESEIKVFTKTNSTHMFTQVNVDLASATGTSVTTTSLAQQDRPGQILRLVKTAHVSALRNAIQNRETLDTPSYILAMPQQDPQGHGPVNDDLTAIRQNLSGNTTILQFNSANRRLLGKTLKYANENLRQHQEDESEGKVNNMSSKFVARSKYKKAKLKQRRTAKGHNEVNNTQDEMQQVVSKVQLLYLYLNDGTTTT